MHADADRLLYLYPRSNKSLCSLVYFLWLGPSGGSSGGGSTNPKSLKGSGGAADVWRDTGAEDKCPMAFSSCAAHKHCRLPDSTVKQIPGKYELVSTCARQKTNTGPTPAPTHGPSLGPGSINMSGGTRHFAESQKSSLGNSAGKQVVC